MLLYEKRGRRFHFYCGYTKGFALGIAINKFYFNLDIGIFWFSIEW